MSIRFSFSHFKGFNKLEPIELKPLTVICGANNSGKSSIIQSLLLMKQSTIGNRTASLDVLSHQEPLILDGEDSALVHLGDWTDVIYKHETDQKMSFKWQLTDQIHADIEVEIKSMTHQKLIVSRFLFKELNTPVSFELIHQANDEKYQLKLTGISLTALLYPWIYDTPPVEWTECNKSRPTVIDNIEFHNISVEFQGIFPKSVQGDFAEQSSDILNQVRNHSGKPDLFSTDKKIELSRKAYRQCSQSLREFWLNLRYLGPVREAPQRHYFIHQTGKTAIGSKGEYTSIVLAEEQEQTIPPYYRCTDDRKALTFEYRSADKMVEAVNGWLSFMQLPQLIPTLVIERRISQIKLNSTGVEVCLPDVGFGVSQILPVLVECLRTKSGETIILEQPEIHLHPSLQSKLSDFLIGIAKAGKNIIVETHSEHLIKRLYLRAAQHESDDLRNLLNTVFVQFDQRQQTSVTQTIVSNEYGEIENWPIGFIDEDDSRELVAATLKKRLGKVRKP